jgi:hypothetical protein
MTLRSRCGVGGLKVALHAFACALHMHMSSLALLLVRPRSRTRTCTRTRTRETQALAQLNAEDAEIGPQLPPKRLKEVTGECVEGVQCGRVQAACAP